MWVLLWVISWCLLRMERRLGTREAHERCPPESNETSTLRQEARMAAYVVIDRLAVTDPETFSAYQDMALLSVTTHGGRYVLPHGTQIEALEGNWTPNRIVLIEFDAADQAKQWWNSPAYERARTIHRHATISNIILVTDSAS
jgi:uncharacterized protein (DUF1330 family)